MTRMYSQSEGIIGPSNSDSLSTGKPPQQLQDAHTTPYFEEGPVIEEEINKVESNGSSGSSTRNESLKNRMLSSDQEMKGIDGTPLDHQATKPEIDSEDRMALHHALTEASERVTRTLSIVSPGDPSVDPSSDQFDLSKFLKLLRRQMDDEDIELKQLSVVYRNMNIFGSGRALQLQKTVGDLLLAPFRIREHLGRSERKQILHSFDGIIKTGELCVVLGRPGSGCSTLLKALTGDLHGLEIDDSEIHYNGIPQNRMIKEFKGETVYNQEVDKHFPHLTVGQTLEFAAAVRTRSNRPGELPRSEYSQFMTKVVMAVLGLSHTYNTKVGDDFVRGVSGGERKRVSVAEMLLAGAPFAAWDNSTRGLDSATALKFVKALRVVSDLAGGAAAVAIYQASQNVYDCFDKAAVLYEGRQIYFGPAAMQKHTSSDRAGIVHPARLPGIFSQQSQILVSASHVKAWRTEFLELPRSLRNTGASRLSTDNYSRRLKNLNEDFLSINTALFRVCGSKSNSIRQSTLAQNLHTSSVFPCRLASAQSVHTSVSWATLLPPPRKPVSIYSSLLSSALSILGTLRELPLLLDAAPFCSSLSSLMLLLLSAK